MTGFTPVETGHSLAGNLRAMVSLRRRLPHQIPPPGNWYGWLLLGGRGSGKTEAAARYVTEHVNGPPCMSGPTPHWISIIAPTLGDAVTSCVNGPSGLKQYDPTAKLAQTSGGTVVRWSNGSEAKLFGAQGPEDVERLRAGGNRCVAWLEELAAWRYLQDAWDQMRFGLRVGPRPRFIASTTPKPRLLIKRLDRGEIPNIVRTHATMFDNPHLPQEIRDALLDAYGGRAIGQQELYAKIIEQDEGALWQRKWLDDHRVLAEQVPDLNRITVGVDPSGGAGEQGIIVTGRHTEYVQGSGSRRAVHHGYTLADRTVMTTPAKWGAAAVNAAVDFDADDIVVETNFGGDMALATVKGAAEAKDLAIPVRKITASRAKRARAEPVAAQAQRGRWHMAGTFSDLEDQMCLVAGTLIETARGQIPVEDISTRDVVMTRDGWARVMWSGMTGIATELTSVQVQNDIILKCTPQHPVYRLESDEFVSAMSVQPGDHLVGRCKSGRTVNQLHGVGTGTVDLRKVDIDTLKESFFIMQSGKYITDRLLQDLSFTISIMIPTTIDLITSSRSRVHSMWSSTGEAQRCRVEHSSVVQAVLSDHSDVVLSGRTRSQKTSPALAVVRSFNRQGLVPCTAPRVVLDVVTETVHPTPVYNLSVKNQPEFFADGVLVHNCTWTDESGYSPDRLDALVWTGWHLRLASTMSLVGATFPGSQIATTSIGA